MNNGAARRICLTWLVGVFFAAGSLAAAPGVDSTDPLVSVDLNRAAIVADIVAGFRSEIAAAYPGREEEVVAELRAQLNGLRADRLLAASLASTFGGLQSVMKESLTARAADMTRAQAKALGDANRDLIYTPLTPCRLIDTRGFGAPIQGGAFAPNERRAYVPNGLCGIPTSGISSLLIGFTTQNLTIGSGGYISILPPGGPVSTIVDIFAAEWSTGTTVVPSGPAGQFDIYVNTASPHVVVDMVGYFSPAPNASVGTTLIADGAVTAAKLAGNGCTNGQVMKYNGAAWVCASVGLTGCNSGDLLPCYTGPQNTLGVGICKSGYKFCDAVTGTFGACTGQVLPAAEIIDGLDNNCNGVVDEDLIAPTVSSTNPTNLATGVPINTTVSVTFSEAMNPATLTTASFTVVGPGGAVAGTVGYVGNTATFTPSSNLAVTSSHTVTVTTAAKDVAGNALASNYIFSFTTSNAPVASVTTPTVVAHNAAVISYSLSEANSSTASVLVEFSSNGGSTWSTATRSGTSGDPITGLTTSPGGTSHVFFWAAQVDGVGTVGQVNNVRVRITPTALSTGVPASTSNFSVNTNSQQVIGVATGIFQRDLVQEREVEMPIGDLAADAMRAAAGTQLFIQSGGSIRSTLPSGFVPTNTALRRSNCCAAGPPYDLVAADVYNVYPFGQYIVTRTITGAQLWAALEISLVNAGTVQTASGGFLQISGFSFAYTAANAQGSRVTSVTLTSNGLPIAADSSTYTIGMSDFTASGGDNYALFNDGLGIKTYKIQADVLFDYVIAQGTITPATSARITRN
jgi:hypothetical protein